MCPVYKLPWLPKNLEVAFKAKKKMASDQLKNYVLQVFRILLLSWPLPSLHGLKKMAKSRIHLSNLRYRKKD